MTHPTPKEEGYRHRGMWLGAHVLETAEGKLELWAANKYHASSGLRYKGTHLEFLSSMTDAQRQTWEALQ